MLCKVAQLAKMTLVRSVQNDPGELFTMKARFQITALLHYNNLFLAILKLKAN